MLPSLNNPDLASVPLTMLAGNILDPLCPAAVKNISEDILNKLSMPVIVINHLGNILLTNEAFGKTMALSNQNVTFNFENINFSDSNLIKLLDYGLPVTGYNDNLRINNKTIPVKINLYPLFNSERHRLGLVCTLEDLTSSSNYLQLQQRCELIFNSMELGFIVLDESLKITMLNKFAKVHLGCKESEVIGKPLDNLMQEFFGDANPISSALANQMELKDYEQSFTLGEQTYYFTINTYFLKNENNQPTGAIITFQDITTAKEMSLKLAQNERFAAIGHMVGETLQGIGNPLTSIKGFVQLVEKNLNEQQKRI
ncbi:hypothetical protein N752_10395 [Desulforamulus aquiferis]|nr:PAS domain-containing protein [Desulforamulus aquiferis]RYD05195.1 hypothetical protein N752_10395 [Desulforamulus aquiferis]